MSHALARIQLTTGVFHILCDFCFMIRQYAENDSESVKEPNIKNEKKNKCATTTITRSRVEAATAIATRKNKKKIATTAMSAINERQNQQQQQEP